MTNEVTYLVALDAVSDTAAMFTIDRTVTTPDRPVVTLPRSHWEALGRPGTVTVTVRT